MKMTLQVDIVRNTVNMNTIRMKLKEMINHMGDTKEPRIPRLRAKAETASSTRASTESRSTFNALPQDWALKVVCKRVRLTSRMGRHKTTTAKQAIKRVSLMVSGTSAPGVDNGFEYKKSFRGGGGKAS